MRDFEKELEQNNKDLLVALLPKDEADEKNVILEIRAGTGGDEAALFAGDLYRMYERYSSLKNWRFQPMEKSETGLKGIKEAVIEIQGDGVFKFLKNIALYNIVRKYKFNVIHINIFNILKIHIRYSYRVC